MALVRTHKKEAAHNSNERGTQHGKQMSWGRIRLQKHLSKSDLRKMLQISNDYKKTFEMLYVKDLGRNHHNLVWCLVERTIANCNAKKMAGHKGGKDRWAIGRPIWPLPWSWCIPNSLCGGKTEQVLPQNYWKSQHGSSLRLWEEIIICPAVGGGGYRSFAHEIVGHWTVTNAHPNLALLLPKF